MFGKTSDGGAFSFLLLIDERKVKQYPRDQTDWDRLLAWLTDELQM